MFARVLQLGDVPLVERKDDMDRVRLLARVLLACILFSGLTMIAMFSSTGGIVKPFNEEATKHMQNALFAQQMAVSVEEVLAAVGPPVDGASSVEEASAAHRVRARVDAGNRVDFFFMLSYTAVHVLLLLFPWVVLRYRAAQAKKQSGEGAAADKTVRRRRRGSEEGGGSEDGEQLAAGEERMEVRGVPYLSLGLFFAFAALLGDGAETLQQLRLNAMSASALRGGQGAEAINLMALAARLKWVCLAVFALIATPLWWALGCTMLELAWAAPRSDADVAAGTAHPAAPRTAYSVRWVRSVRAWFLRVGVVLSFVACAALLLFALALRPAVGLALRSAAASLGVHDALLGPPSRWVDGRWLVETSVPVLALGYVLAFLAALSFEADSSIRAHEKAQ